MALVGSMVVSVTAQTAPFQQGMGQAANSVKQVQQTVMTAQGTISGLEKSLMGLAAQYIGLQQLVNAMRSLVEVGREMELLKITAANVFGGQQEGGQAIEKMSVLAERLGINFKDLVRGFTNVTAASRGTKVEGVETEKMFTQLVSITRALGQSSDQTAGSILAVQQILTKGTIMAEEFRGQLGERLPGILQAGAKTFGVSLESFSKSMERGEFGAKALANIFNTFFNDVGRKADAAANTFDAAVARMNNAWIKLGEALMTGGTATALKFIADRFTEIIKGAEIIAKMIPGGKIPSPEAAVRGPDVATDFATIAGVKELEAMRKKHTELQTQIEKTKQVGTDLVDPQDIQNYLTVLADLEQQLVDNSRAYKDLTVEVDRLNQVSIATEVGKRIDEFAKQTAENQIKAIESFIDQAEVKLKEFDAIRNDTRRRGAMMPEGKEFFARDALSDTKKLLDTITSLVAKIREAASITPGVTQPMREAIDQIEQRAKDIPAFRKDQQGIITSLEQIEDLYRRIGRIREENETMTKGREEAQVGAEMRARQLQLEMEEAKRQFLLNPTVGGAMAQSALDFAIADQQKLIGDAARETIKEFGTKEFDELHLKLLQQAEDLDRGAKSWAEMRASVASLKPELQSILDLDLERIRIRRELNQITEDNGKRERELADIYDGVRDEIDQLILTEDELFRKRASRAMEAPFSRVITPLAEATELQTELSAMFERGRFSGIPDSLTAAQEQLGADTARRAIKDLRDQQSATVNDMIRGLFDQNRALTMTTEQLQEYELALNNADDAQKDLARSLLDKNKIAEFSSALSDFAIDFATQDVFDLIKGQPVDTGLQQDRLRLQFLKEDIAKAEAQLAQLTPTTPAMREQIRKQSEVLTDFKREYATTQESIRQETAKTETVFEQYMRKLSQFLLKLFLDSSEANKQLTNLINQGIQGVLSLIGSVGSVTAAAGSTGRTIDVVGAEGVAATTVIPRQHGGTFFKGQPMMVGEAGPELVFPLVPGVVMTNRQTQAALSSGISTVTFNIYAQDAPSVIQSRGAISRALVSAISQAQRSL